MNNNLVYPTVAQKNKTEGKVYAQFLINIDGSISDIKIVKDIGDGCGDAAKDVIMFISENYRLQTRSQSVARSRGRVEKVLFTLPVDFCL